MKRLLLLTALLCALAGPLAAQVPVSMAPVTKFQFLSNAGIPLAAGCLTTFQAGTTNLAATYTESTGTSLNTNPIILDGGGRADIWIPNASFKFQLKSAGGVNCATGSTLWTVDGISGVLGLLNLNNIFTGSNTFNQPIIIAVNSNQIVAGSPGAQTTLNFPAPAGNITQNMLSVADTYVGLVTPQTLTNKTLATPTITNPIINGASTGTGVQGTDTKLLTSSTIAGTGAALCTDANGGATTTGCVQGVMQSGAYTNATTTFTDITGLSFTAAANGNYRMSCDILFQGSAGTAGPKFQFTGPAAPSVAQVSVDGGTNATTYGNTFVSGFSVGNTALGVLGAAGVNLTAHVSLGLRNGANAGLVQLQAAANGAGTLTTFAGSACTIQGTN